VQQAIGWLRFEDSILSIRSIDPVILSVNAILIVGDMFEPVDGAAVEFFLDGEVGQGGGGRGAVPMFFAWLEPDDVAGPDFLDRAAPPLGPAAAFHHDERLPERMRMPSRPCPRLERHADRGDPRGLRRVEEPLDADRAGEVLGRA